MKKVIVISSLFMAISLCAVAQVRGASTGEEQQAFGASAPSATFQTTSSMSGSGSSYSATPTLNADGTAAYDGEAYSPAKAAGRPGGLKRNPIFDDKTDDGNTPIGDAVLPLMMLLCAYAGYKVLARKRA